MHFSSNHIIPSLYYMNFQPKEGVHVRNDSLCVNSDDSRINKYKIDFLSPGAWRGKCQKN